MCKLEGIKWTVIKSDRLISKNLASKINKIISCSVTENRIYFWGLKPELKEVILGILKSYKYQKFEICEFYDKQFGLTLNYWTGGNLNTFEKNVEKLPLKKTFWWSNEKSEILTVTPITTKQWKNIIKIN